MTRPDPTTAPRGRGRPPKAGTADTRQAILDAARTQFASKGFDGASMRAIGTQAGVDPSLISHYFGDKARLLVATMALPVDPVAKITGALAGERADLGERLVRAFLEAWDPHREVMSMLVRTSLGSGDAHVPMLEVARGVVSALIAERLEGEDRALRATLVASQIVGLAVLRYVACVAPLAGASVDDVARLYGPALQQVLDRP
jgi:AcrR family transcriptional regulator